MAQLDLVDLNIQSWILVTFFLLLPMGLIRRPDVLSLLATFANVIVAFATVSVIVHLLMYTSNWKANLTVTWSKLPSTVGTIAFSYEIAPLVSTKE